MRDPPFRSTHGKYGDGGLSRHTGYDANLTRMVLESWATACRSCAEECGHHSDAHAHCRICAAVSRRCESACRDLVSALA